MKRAELVEKFVEKFSQKRGGLLWPMSESGLREWARDSNVKQLRLFLSNKWDKGSSSERIFWLARTKKNKLAKHITCKEAGNET